MNKFERAFDRFTDRFQLNPGNWLPHVKPNGIYEMGTRYDDTSEDLLDEKGEVREGTTVPMEAYSIWDVFWTIAHHRRTERGEEKASRWEQIWGFLSDVDLGIYDTTNWVPVEPSAARARFSDVEMSAEGTKVRLEELQTSADHRSARPHPPAGGEPGE